MKGRPQKMQTHRQQSIPYGYVRKSTLLFDIHIATITKDVRHQDLRNMVRNRRLKPNQRALLHNLPSMIQNLLARHESFRKPQIDIILTCKLSYRPSCILASAIVVSDTSIPVMLLAILRYRTVVWPLPQPKSNTSNHLSPSPIFNVCMTMLVNSFAR